jgi:mannose-6-phosphate isomerase-like protein (cupin superfamily)
VYSARGYRSLVAASFLQAAGFGDVADLLGGYRAWEGAGLPVVGAEETAGLLGASVVTQPPGQASLLHVHTREAEAWLLLQGAMTYRAGEQLIRMTAGDFIYLPREVPHAFRTTGTVPVRFLALTLPGGLLGIYDEAGVPAAERRLPDAGVSDADVARWLELAPRYGLRVAGPPIPEAEA